MSKALNVKVEGIMQKGGTCWVFVYSLHTQQIPRACCSIETAKGHFPNNMINNLVINGSWDLQVQTNRPEFKHNYNSLTFTQGKFQTII